MKQAIIILLLTALALPSLAGTTITYTYDKQHRLTSADYSATQADAHVAYQYDAANNLDVYVAITDAQYLESWMLYFSSFDPLSVPDLARISWLLAFNDAVRLANEDGRLATEM